MNKEALQSALGRYGVLGIWVASVIGLAQKALGAFAVDGGTGWAAFAEGADTTYTAMATIVVAGLLHPLYRKFWPTAPEPPAAPEPEPEGR